MRLNGESSTAPYRSYKETDETIYADGYKSGLGWPAKWDHVPGGPYYPDRRTAVDTKRDHPDWIAYCALLRHHNGVWLKAWHEGFAENARKNPAIKRLRSKLIMDKVSG